MLVAADKGCANPVYAVSDKGEFDTANNANLQYYMDCATEEVRQNVASSTSGLCPQRVIGPQIENPNEGWQGIYNGVLVTLKIKRT